MKKTSRRTFAKQLTGAIAATAATSFVAKGDEAPNESRQPKSQPRIESTHNTPPPLEFINGSLIVENAVEFDSDGPSSDGSRMEYRMNPRTGSVIRPAHIRILKGNGESHRFYESNTARYLVTIELRDENATAGSSMLIKAQSTPNQDRFVIDLERNRTLHPGNSANNDRPSSRKRHHRYRHSGTANPNITMYRITIRDLVTNTDVDTIMPRTLPAQGQDLRVMIWLEPWPQPA